MRVFTKSLTSGSISIGASDYVYQISVQANESSSCTIEGNISFGGMTSDAIILENGENVTITAYANSAIQGVTITWLSGTVDVLITF